MVAQSSEEREWRQALAYLQYQRSYAANVRFWLCLAVVSFPLLWLMGCCDGLDWLWALWVLAAFAWSRSADIDVTYVQYYVHLRNTHPEWEV